MYGLRVFLWCIGLVKLLRPPTASCPKSARVYCGCQPGPTRVALHPGRMVGTSERQPYVHWTTCCDYRGDVDYRRVFLHQMSQVIQISGMFQIFQKYSKIQTFQIFQTLHHTFLISHKYCKLFKYSQYFQISQIFQRFQRTSKISKIYPNILLDSHIFPNIPNVPNYSKVEEDQTKRLQTCSGTSLPVDDNRHVSLTTG